MESVICPMRRLLTDPVTAMKTRTKTTPIIMSDAVRRVLLRYLKRFLMAILRRLYMGISSCILPVNDRSVLQGIDYFRGADLFSDHGWRR